MPGAALAQAPAAPHARCQQARTAAGHQELRPLRHRQDRRSLHRLLPVRLRQLDQEQPHPFRPGALGCARSRCSSERNRYLLWQDLDAAAKDPKDPAAKAVRRLLRRLHGYRHGREKGPRAHPARLETDRRLSTTPASSPPCSATLKTTARPTASSTSASTRTRRTRPNRSPKSTRAASRCPTATTTSSIRRASRPSAPSMSPT